MWRRPREQQEDSKVLRPITRLALGEALNAQVGGEVPRQSSLRRDHAVPGDPDDEGKFEALIGEPGHMAHLRPGARRPCRRGEVAGGSARIAASRGPRCRSGCALATVPRGERGVAEREAGRLRARGLELAGERALDRPVPRIVDPRGLLVEHRAGILAKNLGTAPRRSRAHWRPLLPAPGPQEPARAPDPTRAGSRVARMPPRGRFRRCPRTRPRHRRRGTGSPRTRR